jgi:Tol biopolymer transport system component
MCGMTDRMLLFLTRLISRALAAFAIVLGISIAVGHVIPTTTLAIDPLNGMTRDIALRDMHHALTVAITRRGADERAPTWSPDGRQLAYLSLQGGVQSLWLMDADGRNRRVINIAATGDAETAALAWSPRGDSIAFTALVGNRQSIFTVDVASGAQRQITATGSSASSPAWSPDGSEMVFAWSLVANQDIFIADVDAATQPLMRETEVQRVTSDYGMDANPAWSPDGEYIAFFSTRDGNSNIYVYDLATQDLRRITYNAARNITPAWSPDGSALLFRTFVDNVWSINSVDTDCLSSGSCTLTPLLRGDYTVAWKP